MDWKPIESAPLEKRILLYWDNIDHCEDGFIYYNDEFGGRYHVLYDGDSINEEPSHFAEFDKPK